MPRKSRQQENNTQSSLKTFVERGHEALQLRARGKTYTEIAQALGYKDSSGAYNAVHRTLKEMKREAASEVRDMELSRLDLLLDAVWGKAMSGDQKSVLAALSILDRRAKYLGLDVPVTQDNRITVSYVQDWRSQMQGGTVTVEVPDKPKLEGGE